MDIMTEIVVDKKILPTKFLPAERAPSETLLRQGKLFEEDSWLMQFVNAVPDIYLILNEERQIVFANKQMLALIGENAQETVRGLRPGEAVNCAHAVEEPGGCGTSEFCRTCGAALAIASSLRGESAVEECRIVQSDGNALDLRVWTTPTDIDETRYTIFAVQDIASEKRRRVLERIFFHDILNTAGVLQGVSELLESASLEEMKELHGMMSVVSSILIDEIQAQKDLMAAETEELEVRQEIIHTESFLQKIQNLYITHHVGEGRNIKLDDMVENVVLMSDRRLLGRVIGNLVKNALEASSQGDTVTLGCKQDGNMVEFWVHNPAFMSRHIQLQVFQRSFSTKGNGRGLGTYSIKLLTERYLHGQVSFSTDEIKGTTFRVTYPVDWNFEA